MKSLIPWFCVIAAGSQVAIAAEGLDAYRQGNYQEAGKILASEPAKDPVTNYYLGMMRLYGYGQLKNDVMALRYFTDSASKSYLPAQLFLGSYYLFDGNSPEQAFQWYKKAADANDISADMYCAGAYLFGYGVKANEDTARKYIIDAAKSGNLIAQYTLAKQFLGSKDSRNRKMGVIWMNKAADKGYQKAQQALLEIDSDGKKIQASQAGSTSKTTEVVQEKPKDARTALSMWLTDDASQNFEQSNYQLKGILTAWSNKAALQNNIYNQPPQMNTVTRKELYKPAFEFVKSTDIPITEYFDVLAPSLSSSQSKNFRFPRFDIDPDIMALQKNDSMVLRHDGLTPLVDVNATRPLPEEVKPFDYIEEKMQGWEQKVNYQYILSQLYLQAILGDATSQFQLGQLYQYGIVVAKNPEQAIIYFQLASEQLDVRSEYNLGMIYLEGQTSPVDYLKGIDWMTDAAFKGSPYAQYVLGNIYENGFVGSDGQQVINPDPAQATAMYYLSSSSHFADAEYRLADYFVKEPNKGLSVADKEKRQHLIKLLYEGAAEQGVAEAYIPLAYYYAMDKDPTKQTKAFEMARREARVGNPMAALLMGMMYERGIAVVPDQVEAIYWYQQAPINPVNSFVLGTYYVQGLGVTKDVGKGRDMLELSAKSGFSYGSLNLAILDQQQGRDFSYNLEKSREAGNSKASLLLADYNLEKADDPNNMKLSRDIYQSLAEKGDKDAQLKLAFLFDRGLGGTANEVMAAHWYAESAAQGQPVAQYLLGQLYQFGKASDAPDYTEAKKWYNASLAHFRPSEVALGYVYETVDEDYANAAKQYVNAANQGDDVAQLNLGLIYEYGKGTAVDMQKAKALFTSAAGQGNAKAMTQLAGLYLKGSIDGKPNNSDAIFWFKKAATLGDSDALYQLGFLAEKGDANQPSLSDAVNYYQKAAALGNEKAQLSLARMYHLGLGVPKDEQRAIDLYKELAADNNPNAQYQLALIYLNGPDAAQQFEAAKSLLKAASDNGNEQAREKIQSISAQQNQHLS